MLRLNGLTELNGAVLPRSESTMANAHRRYSCIVGMCGGDQRTSKLQKSSPRNNQNPNRDKFVLVL